MKKKLKEFQGFFYVLPSFVLILTFSILPLFMNLYYSFTDYNVLQKPNLVGLKNYIRMFKDYQVIDSIRNTAIYTVLTVPVQTILALILAAILAEFFQNHFGNFVKSALFIPTIASAVLIGSLWGLFLSPRGVINTMLGTVGLKTVNWLGGRFSSLISVCFVSVWRAVGYFLVIYYAGIMNISRELHEAAMVDGANRIQRFFNITLPGVKNITFLVVTLGTIWSFQVFDLVYIMTGGGPGTSTTTLVMTIYKAAFKEYNMGYASAVALLLFVLILIINVIQRVFLTEKEG